MRTVGVARLQDPALLACDSYGQILITQPGALATVPTNRTRDGSVASVALKQSDSRLPIGLSISLSADRVGKQEVISVVQRRDAAVMYCKFVLDETA